MYLVSFICIICIFFDENFSSCFKIILYYFINCLVDWVRAIFSGDTITMLKIIFLSKLILKNFDLFENPWLNGKQVRNWQRCVGVSVCEVGKRGVVYFLMATKKFLLPAKIFTISRVLIILTFFDTCFNNLQKDFH